ncbi:hypothetical protein AB0C93_12020 [Streptomyces sp. NPDC048518]|uniref:hypothetical protein n=1 Tax=Streptomyces sp. NPDC048518 TaxID=3155029 RepID=UPI0033D5DD19
MPGLAGDFRQADRGLAELEHGAMIGVGGSVTPRTCGGMRKRSATWRREFVSLGERLPSSIAETVVLS